MKESARIASRPWLWPVLVLLVVYKFVFSPLLHFMTPGAGCRYTPSCSAYAGNVLIRFGLIRGLWLAARRFLDCHPWGHFGHDPAPEKWPGWWAPRKHYYGSGAEKPDDIDTHAHTRCSHAR